MCGLVSQSLHRAVAPVRALASVLVLALLLGQLLFLAGESLPWPLSSSSKPGQRAPFSRTAASKYACEDSRI